ncbi:hypothetical protein KY359_02070 [Candidatus Woesearchaeota archaeon]|nr:hypothetical protein [Candidatus Woesearchaeota archaeon]
MTSYSGFEGSAFLIFLTINGASGDRLHPYYNLDRLSAGPLEGKLTTSQQVEVLRAALEQIAEIDPRVKGETGAPVARITKVGKEAYDVNFFKAMYQYVQEQASTTGH